ncbi:hypothetical protein Tco_1456680 [Tanacetum coccineum]
MINQEKLNMDFQNELNRLQEMMNLINSNQDPPIDLYHLKGSDKGDNKIDSLTKEPLDTLLMGDDVISTIPTRETDEFIKPSVDDLVSIPRESEVTSDNDLECDIPATTLVPTIDVRKEKVDIDLPFGEHLDTLSTGDREIDFNPSRDIKELERLLADDPVPVPRVFNEPLGDDTNPRSYDVTFSNPLFDFNDDYTLYYDNPFFDEEFEDIKIPSGESKYAALQTKLLRHVRIVPSGSTFDDALCVFNTSMEIDFLSNPNGLVAISKGGSNFRLASCGSDSWAGTGYEWDFGCKEVDIRLGGGCDKALRRADMLLYSWDGGLDVCVDLTGSSPLTQTGMADFVPGRAVINAAQRKRSKYIAKCAAIGYGFLPFSFSSLGELEADAVTLLKRIQKFSMTQVIRAHAAIHIFNRISFAIAKGVGA